MSEALLQMRSIGKTFGPVRALGDVSMNVTRGEIHAICGENGAGKSTLMNVLSGLYPHGTYEGEILYDGEEMRFKSLRDSEALGIVIIHQELGLSPYLSIGENIFLGNERSKAGVIDWPTTMASARDLLARVGLGERPETRVMDIGVGKQQLVEIAKALSKNVRLLILDEPTAALNDEDSAHLGVCNQGARLRQRHGHADATMCDDSRLRREVPSKFVLDQSEQLIVQPKRAPGPFGFSHAQQQGKLQPVRLGNVLQCFFD